MTTIIIHKKPQSFIHLKNNNLKLHKMLFYKADPQNYLEQRIFTQNTALK